MTTTGIRPLRALPFLDFAMREQKPRRRGLTIVRDRMYPLGLQGEFVKTYAAFVDYAKISNITACLYPESLLQAKIDLYLEHRVTPMFGGLVFEQAFAQRKVDAFIDYVSAKSAAVEISNNIVNVPLAQRLKTIERLRGRGVEVLSEVGEKYPLSPFDVAAMVAEIERLHDAGVGLVVLERAEIGAVLGADGKASTAHRLRELFDRVGHERMLAEVESREHILYLIKTFGPEVNLGPNIDWPFVPWIEPLRAGIGKEIGHPAIANSAILNGIELRSGYRSTD